MNVVNLKKEEVKDKEIISYYTFKDKININNDNYEILYVQLSDLNNYTVNIDKTYTSFNCIYTMSFSHDILVNTNEQNNVKQYPYNFFVAHSFDSENKDLEVDIYPVSFGYSKINFEMHFFITYAFTKINGSQHIKVEEKNKLYKESNKLSKEMDLSNLNYINISKEFL